MEWYSGSINDAVKTSKVNKAIFVVFVAGVFIIIGYINTSTRHFTICVIIYNCLIICK